MSDNAARRDGEEAAEVVHATSWWQRPLGWLGIATRAYCSELIVDRRVVGPSRECRECRRAVDGER